MLKKVFTGFAIFLVLAVAVLTGLAWTLAASSRSMDVASGHNNGQLLPCPNTPNCVSSQAPATDSHYIKPIIDGDASRWSRLADTLDALDGATRESLDSNYAYYSFRTPLMGFVDDVEFLHAPERGVIHVRSASRIGKSDLNTNRTRVENIRSRLE